MRIDVVSIFPSYFDGLTLSLLGKAQDAGILDLQVHDLRDWTHDRHRTVDYTPYGGGAGMVMKPEPWGAALDELVSSVPERPSSRSARSGTAERPTIIFPSPAGEV
ncbi:MAG: tRNA (guanosine(37)-N1)-methyltransferase TrmD, partial [Microbacterium sp.]|nr:tRNA (guanosine(37)-N1)-methyltransferase TrmD [Microbacterium sp.]